jgi:type IV secretion system protein VirD4
MRAATVAKAAAWIVVPLAVAQPIASAILSTGLFGWSEAAHLVPGAELLTGPARLSTWQALTSVPTYLWYYPHSPSVQLWAAVGIAAALAIVAVPAGYLAYALWLRRRRLRPARTGQRADEPERAASRTHGAADWLTMQEAAEIFPGEDPDWGGIPVAEAYRPDRDPTRRPFDEDDPATWGQGGRSPLLLSPLTKGAISGIIIAGPGSYKTMGFTIPAMCTWGGSAVVLDPSRQVGAMVKPMREAMGHQVVLIDPANPEGGSFNPLACIDTNHPEAESHLEEFVDWCATGQGDDKGADENGKTFAEWGQELQVCLLADMVWDTGIPASGKTLREWRSRIVTPENKIKKLLADIHAESKSSYARDLAGTLVTTHPKTFTGLYRHAAGDTKWLSMPAYAELFSGDTFDPRMLTGGAMTIIVQIGGGAMKATPAVGRVIIGSLARVMLRAEGRAATPVPFILDEVDNLKYMPILEELRDMGRKSGVALFPMWQSIGQIEKSWGEDGKKSWYNSAAWRLYAMVNDEATAEEVSKRCGTYTVLARTEGDSTSTGGALSNVSRTRGFNGNVSEQARPLISAYEVQTALRPDEAIVIPKGKPAMRCGRPLFWRRPEMANAVETDRYRRASKEPATTRKLPPMISRTVALAVCLLLAPPVMAAEPAETTIVIPSGWVSVPMDPPPLPGTTAAASYKPLSTVQQGQPHVVCSTLTSKNQLEGSAELDRNTERSANLFLHKPIVTPPAPNGLTSMATMDSAEIIAVSGHSAVLSTSTVTITTADGRAVEGGRILAVAFVVPGAHYMASCTAGGPTQEEADYEWGLWGPILREIVLSYRLVP